VTVDAPTPDPRLTFLEDRVTALHDGVDGAVEILNEVVGVESAPELDDIIQRALAILNRVL
jgi:hypothetical protein